MGEPLAFFNNIWGIPTGENVVLKLNSFKMLVGTSDKKFQKLGGKYVRSEKLLVYQEG
jgi:hypothetical protein